MRYFFHIAYTGHNFRGWQRQPGVKSVQGAIEETIRKILKIPISINGCGRTDAEVHAAQFFFHLDIEEYPKFDFLFRINKALPPSISVFDILPVGDKSHARFDAVQRKYDYFIHTQKDPFLKDSSSFYQIEDLDLGKIKAATALLPKYKDYRAFCVHADKNEHTICNVSEAIFYKNEKGNRFRFHIVSNRFLGKMIRILAGTILKVGQSEMTLDEFESLLISLEQPKILEIGHPTGLFLSKVTYPYLNLEPSAGYLLNLNAQNWQPI